MTIAPRRHARAKIRICFNIEILDSTLEEARLKKGRKVFGGCPPYFVK
jgi:hypothetical protein